MTTGGLGERLVRDSFAYMLRAMLDELGWFDTGRQHQPIQFINAPLKWDEPVDPNIIAINWGDIDEEDGEVGNFTFIRQDTVITVILYVESEALGVDLQGDVVDILRGNHPSIGRVRASFQVLDFTQATPPVIGYGIIGDVNADSVPTSVRRDWMAHWYQVNFTISRSFGVED